MLTCRLRAVEDDGRWQTQPLALFSPSNVFENTHHWCVCTVLDVRYVLRSIYQTEPVGGQSRAEGTGGSTPPFLKLFLDQTIGPGRNFIIQLLLQKEELNEAELDEVRHYANKFDEFENAMGKVRQKGQRLEHDEKVVNFH